MSFPDPARRYLDALLGGQNHPFTVRLGHNFCLQDWWGDAGVHGLGDLSQGVDLRGLAPWLHGLDLTAKAVVPHISVTGGSSFDIHVLPDAESTLILFLPSTDAMQAKNRSQQTTNEVRLLNIEQRRLLDRLAVAKRETERANEVKSRFIAGMSHEFRTPLTSVLGYADLIHEQVHAEQELSAHAAAIGRAARHLLSMVDNVLDQARLEEDSVVLHIGPVDVRHVTDDLAAIVAPLAAQKLLGFGAYVATDMPQLVLTDVVRLRQVLLNLLGNAIKFTSEGEVRLEIDWRDGQLHASVIDTGPGIAAGEKDSIFQAFQRGSHSEGTPGAGLGLNITRRLLELLNGEVWVESEPGEGSRFSIRVPAPVADPQPLAAKPVAEAKAPLDHDSKRILVAEDDPDIVQLVQIILGRAGYQLSLANNGQQAIERALADRPDIIIMDVNMPGLDGLGATRALRERGFEGPIIALTASLSANDRNQAFEAGCDGYLIKPISSSELLSAIARHLETA